MITDIYLKSAAKQKKKAILISY